MSWGGGIVPLILNIGAGLVGWGTPSSSRFTPGKEIRCPLYSKFGEPADRPEPSGKKSSLQGFEVRTVQPVACRYADYAIPVAAVTVALLKHYNLGNIIFTIFISVIIKFNKMYSPMSAMYIAP